MENQEKLRFPISDWILISFYVIIYPLVFGITLVLFLFILNDKTSQLLGLNIIMIIFLMINLFLYQLVFRKLNEYAKKVDFYHFTPSLADLLIHLIKQVYYVVFLGFLFTFVLDFLTILPKTTLTGYLGFSIVISLLFEGILVVIRMQRKIALVQTAQEPVKDVIIQELYVNVPESRIISEFRFADIQIPTLFLSAGVTTFGLKKYICLVSRYFNWKLTDEELIAVLLHEVGHIKNHHIRKSYLIIGTEVILRSLRIFIIIIMLLVISGHLETLKFDLYSIFFLGLVFNAFLSSAFLNFVHRYRVYLAEIWADDFSAKRVGALEVADILRKLPQLIPSPLVYDQSSFLGFRVNLLRKSVKKH
jgi:Zn-dependent protease with chaperone function